MRKPHPSLSPVNRKDGPEYRRKAETLRKAGEGFRGAQQELWMLSEHFPLDLLALGYVNFLKDYVRLIFFNVRALG